MNQLKLAFFDQTPLFKRKIPIGQLYFPSWERYVSMTKKIFDRQYYTNHGPFLEQLEHELQNFFNVKHVICVTNATIGLIMAAEALELSGTVIVPSFTFIATAQSLTWNNIVPRFCDIDPLTYQLDIHQIHNLIDENVTGILAVNLWGSSCLPSALELFAKSRKIKVYFDSAHAFGCSIDNKKIGNFGELEVFSFHATKILNAAEGGCICTNSDDIAAKLRNIRSSYGSGKAVSVTKTSNGRMSEAQAGLALLSLEDFEKNRDNNQKLFLQYYKLLKQIPGIKMLSPQNITFSNYQYAVCEIDELKFGLSRDILLSLLKAENINARRYFFPGIHNTIQFKKFYNTQNNSLKFTEDACEKCLQLPIGASITAESINLICELISNIQLNAKNILFLLKKEKLMQNKSLYTETVPNNF